MVLKLKAIIYNEKGRFLTLTNEATKNLYLPGTDKIIEDRAEVALNHGLIGSLGFGLNKLIRLPIPSLRMCGPLGSNYTHYYYKLRPGYSFTQNKESDVSVIWLTVNGFNNKRTSGYTAEPLFAEAIEHANKTRTTLMSAFPYTRTKPIKG